MLASQKLKKARNSSQDQLYKQLFAGIKCMAQLCHWHHQEENTNHHLLLRGNWSGWSRVNKKPPKSKSVCQQLLIQYSVQVCFTSTSPCSRPLTGTKKKLSGEKLSGHMNHKLTALCQLPVGSVPGPSPTGKAGPT